MRFLFDHDVPDEMAYSLRAMGHEVTELRIVLPKDTKDRDVLKWASDNERVLVTCNRDDFLELAAKQVHAGLIILIRRRSRALERAALVRLLDQAGEAGIRGNVNFA